MNGKVSSLVPRAAGMVWLALAPLLCGSLQKSVEPVAPRAHTSWLAGTTDRTMVGDWETPNLLAIVHDEAFAEAGGAILAHAAENHSVAYLLDVERSDGVSVQVSAQAWGNIELFVHPLDTPWIRDYGPLQARQADGRIVWLDADYTFDRPNDDALPRGLALELGVDVEALGEQLDGGAIISNGMGLCVSTLEAFGEAHLPRGQGMRSEALLQQLGCLALVLTPALVWESTKHVDMFAQFLGPNIVAIADLDAEESPDDHARMEEAARAIRQAGEDLGQSMKVVRLPMTRRGTTYLTYLNSTRVGQTLFMPQYEDDSPMVEAAAYSILRNALPGVTIVAVPADDLIENGGAVHCLTLGLHVGNPADERIRAGERIREVARRRAGLKARRRL